MFLTADAARTGNPALAQRLRVRTLAVGVLAGAIVFAGLYPIRLDAPTLSHGLLHAALPLMVISALAGVMTLFLVYRRSYSIARFFAASAVAAVVAGWGVGQYPWMLVDQLTINDAAGARATLTALLVVVALAGVIVLPALAYLLRLTQSEKWSHPRDADVAQQSQPMTSLTQVAHALPASGWQWANEAIEARSYRWQVCRTPLLAVTVNGC